VETPLDARNPPAVRRLPRIACTIGDINGIGPEVLLKALSLSAIHDQCRCLIVGSRRLISTYARAIPCGPIEEADEGIAAGGRLVPIVDIPTDAEIALGQVMPDAGRLAGESIRRAATMAIAGEVDAVVTMPVSKTALNAGGFDFPGHTEMLAALGGGRPLMMLIAHGMRVAVATSHVSLANVPRLITWALLEEKLRDLHESLRRDFGIDRPRIAVLALNPHGGEDGLFGREELDVIGPSVRRLASEGIEVMGPLAADGFFARYVPGEYDAILAMYHDQGLIPLKMFARGGGVNYTAGLPIVRTSPDHGTAFSIAGLGIADETSTIEAIVASASIVHERRAQHQ